jgi:hypothetical protein
VLRDPGSDGRSGGWGHSGVDKDRHRVRVYRV